MADYGDLTKVLEEQIKNWDGKAATESTGFVVQVGDSVATIHGLSKAIYGELLDFASGAVGIALNLEEDVVGCVLFSR